MRSSTLNSTRNLTSRHLHRVQHKMLSAHIRSFTLLLSIFLLGSSAPRLPHHLRTLRTHGFGDTIRRGQVTDKVNEFITRLSTRGFLASNQIKLWIDTETLPTHRQRLQSALFQHGLNRNPMVLSLGTNTAGARMAVSLIKPDTETAALLAGSRRPRFKGWNTRRGLVLMHLTSREQPKVVGWLAIKSQAAASALKNSQDQLTLDELERIQGLIGILRVV